MEPTYATQTTSDGYALHRTTWQPEGRARGRVIVLHGVQSHGGWYHNLGRTLANAGYETHFPDRRGSGANVQDRGHTPSARRLLDDLSELLVQLRESHATLPTALAGISWGGKLAVLTAGREPDLVDALALICPGLHPRVGVSTAERLRIAWAFFTKPQKRFPIPLADPSLFTAYPEGQAFITNDPLSLRDATASLLAASTFIDRQVARIPPKVRQPVLLMLAGQDRIVDNDRTLAYCQKLATRSRTVIDYPEGHHTLEFEPDPGLYARDLIGWLDSVFSNR